MEGMMRITILAMAIPIMIGGCVQQRQREAMEANQKAIQEDNAKYASAKNACATQYPNQHALKVDCFTESENHYWRPHYRYGDLLDLYQAQRKSIAVKADRGEVTLEDGAIQLAQLRSAWAEAELRRNNETAAINAQRALAGAAIMGSTAPTAPTAPYIPTPYVPNINVAPGNPLPPINPLPPPITTICQSVGGQFICNRQ
jgi:lipopolysaccharide export system protein LptC